MLLDPLAEQFELPAVLVERADSGARQCDLVGEEDERLVGIGVFESNPAQMRGVAQPRIETVGRNSLIASNDDAAIRLGRIDAMEVYVRLAPRDEERARQVENVKAIEIDIRNSLDYASWKDRKALAAAIKPIYTASSAEAALAELDAFAQGAWGQKFPTVAAAWRRAWDRVIPFFAFPSPIGRVIYTTNAIESINARLRKTIKTRGHFPSDDAATKLIWLVLRNITADWGRAAKDWKEAMNQFAILYAERFETARA